MSNRWRSFSKTAGVGYLGALFMIIGFLSVWGNLSDKAQVFKAINLAGATAAICLAGIAQHTKKMGDS